MGLIANAMVIEMCYKVKQTIENRKERRRSCSREDQGGKDRVKGNADSERRQ